MTKRELKPEEKEITTLNVIFLQKEQKRISYEIEKRKLEIEKGLEIEMEQEKKKKEVETVKLKQSLEEVKFTLEAAQKHLKEGVVAKKVEEVMTTVSFRVPVNYVETFKKVVREDYGFVSCRR